MQLREGQVPGWLKFRYLRKILMCLPPRKLIFTVLILIALISLIFALANLFKVPAYTIFVDGDQVVVESQFETVVDIVNSAGINLRPEDLVSPPLGELADPEKAITIRRAMPVKIHKEANPLTSISGIGEEQVFYTQQAYLGPFLLETGTWLMPGDDVFADGRLLNREELTTTALPETVEIARRKEISVQDGETEIKLTTFASTVGEALIDVNIRLFSADVVSPSLRTLLQNQSEITITRAKSVTVKVDNRLKHARSQAEKVSNLLEEMAITLQGNDYTIPDVNADLDAGDLVEVIRVTEVVTHTDENIPYNSLSQLTAELELDQRAIIQAGAPGTLRRSTLIRYENGIEVGREQASETLIRAPVDEVLGIGTKVVVRTVETPEGPLEYWRVVHMRVTAYTAATSGKDPSHPAYGITASGVPAGFGVVAVDPTIVPFRSYVYVPGYGRAFAGDTGGGVKGRFIDLGYNDGEIVAWNGYVDVYYLTPVPPADQINYLLPTTLP